MKHTFTVEVESDSKNWHDVADELAKAAIESENSIQNIQVFQAARGHEASR